MKKQEDRRTELNIKAKALDQEGTEFHRKLQNNGFISEARAIEARDQLLVKQENFRRLQQEMMDKASREQSELNKQLFDEITNFLKEYNKEKGFSIVEYSVGWKCFICRGWFRYHERDCRSLECQLQKGR